MFTVMYEVQSPSDKYVNAAAYYYLYYLLIIWTIVRFKFEQFIKVFQLSFVEHLEKVVSEKKLTTKTSH